MKRYNPKEIEPKWQKWWAENNTYVADLASSKQKYMASGMFNYPSGDGIHVGHAYTFTIPDVLARYKRQQGFESLNPVGWDAFGLPAENYAIKAGISPQESMATIIPNYRKQYTAMGWGVDWTKEITSSEPIYYKWTQWIFSQMYKNGLAYQGARMQWWCDQCQTVLANEQVIDGKCWRHDKAPDPVIEKKKVKQWFFKITEYADELLEAVDDLNWTESVKLAQKNWIGKSKGAEIDFALANLGTSIKVFTTRPDTLFGATFMVLAPEHELVEQITTEKQKSVVEEYVKKAQAKSDLERQENKEKSGVFTGAYVINPVNNEQIPVWIADYVLPGYGTGAIMAVPAHDERDYEFAKKFDLPIVEVVEAKTFDKENPPREGKKNTKRNVVICVIKNKNGKFLTLKWRKLDWQNFVMGGVEAGEDIIESAKREIAEETGYTDVKYIGRMPFALNSIFYAAHKDVNRDIRVDVLQFELLSDKQQEKELADYEDFESVWVDQKDLPSLHPVGGLEYIVRWIGEGDYAYGGEGRLIASGKYSGLDTFRAREEIVADLGKKGVAKEKVNYKMRDWSVSRQRYWGAPIPIVNCKKCGQVLVPDEDLPVVLPELTDFKPSGDGRSALARAKDWLQVDCPECGSEAERETDTLDTYICSSWYLYRYIDPHNQQKIFDSELVNKWFPIDFYDGADHATAHLLYARFIGRFFHKLGLVDNPEPIDEMLYHGKVLGSDGSHFSKSAGNGVDPLEVIDSGYGADALRTYLMFAAPAGFDIRWDPQGVPGTHRFLTRLWNLVQEYLEAGNREQVVGDRELLQVTHRMIKKMTEDIEGNRYNTAIAAAMGGLNSLYKLKNSLAKTDAWQQALEHIVACIAPFAPHIADELWQQLGHSTSVHLGTWPKWDEKYLVSDTMKIVVQVNGKVRANIEVPADASEEQVLEAAKANEKVTAYLDGNSVKKSIYVPNKLVNFVV